MSTHTKEDWLHWSRQMAIQILDTQHGIHEKAFLVLDSMIRMSNDEVLLEILSLVKATDGYYYLPEDWKDDFSVDLLTELP